MIKTDALIIGAGPAGLFTAHQLKLIGLNCEIVDNLDKIGGQCIELYPDKPIYDIPAIPECTGEKLTNNLIKQLKPFEIKFHLRERVDEVKKMVEVLKGDIEVFPWHEKMQPSINDPVEGTLRRTWKPALSYVGMDGVPAVKDGGNVLRPYTSLKLSLRLPPDVDCHVAMAEVEKVLTETPPYQATVHTDWEEPANGWNAPKLSSWLDHAIQEASKTFYGKPALAMGEGGTIPFMAMLGEKFPKAQFVITGVLGPGSNAHGPNEFLHISFAKKLSACIGYILNQFPD